MPARPFTIHVSQSLLDDLDGRLAHTRWPTAVSDGTWQDGADCGYVQELCHYWRTGFDWRAAERGLNEYPQFLMQVDGLDLHFAHLVPTDCPRFPLLLLHGWPGSLFEYLEPARLLAARAPDGADRGYEVVVASLPGFGFGGQPREPGWGVSRTARALDTLMDRLGHAEYGVVGSDWGSAVAAHLAATVPERCRAIYTTPQFAPTPREPSPEVAAWASDFRRRMHDDLGYSHIQRTRPDSLSLAQNDSPAGLAAWVVEKFRAWGDTGGDVESAFSKDVLLTNLMFYWAPGSVAGAARIYRELTRDPEALAYPRVEVPTAIGAFPADPFGLPREIVEQRYNVVRWTDFERGGHFPGLEVPTLLAADVRAFFTGQLAP